MCNEPRRFAFVVALAAVLLPGTRAAAQDRIGARAYASLFEADARFDPVPPFDLRPPSSETAFEALQQQKPAEPHHTGFQALIRGTASDFAAFPRRRSTWVILGIGAASAALAHPWDDDLNDRVDESSTLTKVMKPGKIIGLGPVQTGAAIGTYLIGRYAIGEEEGRTNRVSHLGFDLLRANILVQALTYGIKVAVRRDRPNGQCCAFPSGHASVTFAAASVLERHFGYRATWPTFVIASYVAAGRITENRHFLSDILFGSALGIASGWTVVGRHGRQDFTLLPVPTRGGIALTASWDLSNGRKMTHAPAARRRST